jgi:hypothetical protein
MNKIGDIFLLIGILALTIHFGSVDLEIIFSLLNQLDQTNIDVLTLITLSIFVGVMSKSAQFGYLQAPFIWKLVICEELKYENIIHPFTFYGGSYLSLNNKLWSLPINNFVRLYSVNNSQTNFIS